MPDKLPELTHSLQGRDLGHLRIVADLWGLELHAPDARAALPKLAAALLDRNLVEEVVETLPENAIPALADLYQNGGRLPWALFSRRYGTVREMGPGRRDRERPDRNPASPAEVLWYRALVARAFFDSPAGPEEFAYIPGDLLALIPIPQVQDQITLGRPASPGERALLIPADDRILDHACTLLAALRLDLPPERIEAFSQEWVRPDALPYPLSPLPLRALLSAARLLDERGRPRPNTTRSFLEAGRGEALSGLAIAWLRSAEFNELCLLPGLQCEGDWSNDPLRTRQTVLDLLATLPVDSWWSLPAFVAAVQDRHPDFQRPAGDYDSWYLRDVESGEYLRGFGHWDEVDGALLRFLVTGPLHWLGLIDLAAPAADRPPAAFRRSAWAIDLLAGTAPVGLPLEDQKFNLTADARVRAPRLAPRAARYLIARFSEWEGQDGETYLYRITPASLERARKGGLRVEHLTRLLRRYAQAVPPSLLQALERWEAEGSQARMEQVVILRVRDPELMRAIHASRAARFLGDPLGPTAVIVNPGAWDKVRSILAELGYLAEVQLD